MQKDNIEKHQEYQQLAISAYEKYKKHAPKNWIELDTTKTIGGFSASAYFKNNEIVLAICGSDSPGDYFISDLQMIIGKMPSQFYDAQKFYKKIKKTIQIQK